MNLAGNRMVSVANPSYTAAYTYSPDGLRLRVQESNAQYTDRWLQPLGPFGAGVAAQRVQPYDGVRPVLEGTLDSQGAFTTLNKYVWEGNSYYDPLVYSLIGGAWRYHMYDGLGSTRQLMLHASPYTVTDTYQYEAFGNLLSSTGTTPNPYRYVGSLGYYQTGNDLMHLGARYYMPEVGRFPQADSLRLVTSQDQRDVDLNAYYYANGNPVMFTDPMGLLPVFVVTCLLQPWCRAVLGCIGGGAISAGVEILVEKLKHDRINWGKVGCIAACGCFEGALLGGGLGHGSSEILERIAILFGVPLGGACVYYCYCKFQS